jgi:hypothetical protein
MGPQAESECNEANARTLDDKPRIRTESRPFQGGAKEVCNRKQAEKCPRDDQISFHGQSPAKKAFQYKFTLSSHGMK